MIEIESDYYFDYSAHDENYYIFKIRFSLNEGWQYDENEIENFDAVGFGFE